MRRYLQLAAVAAALAVAPALAGPSYDFDRRQLESILADLKAWLPGAWDSYPQIWYERNVTMPEEGEHEHWHRTFALIDAPQVGEVVFYGQINLGGRDGPVLPRSEIVYTARIDENRGVDLRERSSESKADAAGAQNTTEEPRRRCQVVDQDRGELRGQARDPVGTKSGCHQSEGPAMVEEDESRHKGRHGCEEPGSTGLCHSGP